MSSSQQQQANSSQSQSTDSQRQEPNPFPYDEYEDNSTWVQSTHLNAECANDYNPNYLTEHPQHFADVNPNEQDEDDDYEIFIPNDDVSDPSDDELSAAEAKVMNAQLDDDNGDVALYSDAVQQAFGKYENEIYHNWQRSDSQDIMFKEMEECMRYMTEEYSTAEMPEKLVERAQESDLNPDAAEFCPSYHAPTTTANQEIIVTSWEPCVAKKREEEQPSYS